MAILENTVVDMEKVMLNKTTDDARETALQILQVQLESPFALLSLLHSNYIPFTQGNVEIFSEPSARPQPQIGDMKIP
jgi:hypothetical protein